MNKIDISPKIGAWGVWDKQGRCWIGTDEGPQTYKDEIINGQTITGWTLARFAASVFNQRAGQGYRFGARLYSTEARVKKDNITLDKDGETALAEILAQARS